MRARIRSAGVAASAAGASAPPSAAAADRFLREETARFPEELVRAYLAGELEAGENVCDH